MGDQVFSIKLSQDEVEMYQKLGASPEIFFMNMHRTLAMIYNVAEMKIENMKEFDETNIVTALIESSNEMVKARKLIMNRNEEEIRNE